MNSNPTPIFSQIFSPNRAFSTRPTGSDLRLLQLLAPILSLPLKHPAWIFRRQAACLVELPQFIGAQRNLRGRDVVGELLGSLGADDDARDLRLVEEPHGRALA